MKISAIVPCLNEEPNIYPVYEQLTENLSRYEDYEIIFIDNGSVEWIESLWRFDREEDGASLTVEMFHEEGNFIINMYVNYLE